MSPLSSSPSIQFRQICHWQRRAINAIDRRKDYCDIILECSSKKIRAVLDQTRALISACTDPDQLKKWTAGAATAATLDEVFTS